MFFLQLVQVGLKPLLLRNETLMKRKKKYFKRYWKISNINPKTMKDSDYISNFFISDMLLCQTHVTLNIIEVI